MLQRKTCKDGHLMDPSWKVCPVCLAPVCGWMVIMNGKHQNKVFTLHEGKRKIGTGADCEVRILIKSISRHHAMIIAKDGKYIVSDLNSVTGTYVNNIQISSKEIIDSDIIKLGEIEFNFKCL